LFPGDSRPFRVDLKLYVELNKIEDDGDYVPLAEVPLKRALRPAIGSATNQRE
jgi:hypothetical protein